MRFTLVGHARNRLAMVLAVGFMPMWIWLMHVYTQVADLHFQVPAAGGDVVANSNHVSQLVGAMNGVTFLMGFMMFMSTFKSADIDRRLVLAGYPRIQLMLAKVVALLLIGALLAAYVVVNLYWWWPVRHVWAMVPAVFTTALVYGGLGILLGALLRGELEGMCIVVMTSIIDLGVQNPTMNPLSDQQLLAFLPLYGPMQASFAAGFASVPAWLYLLPGAGWFVVTSTVGLAVFWFRTRSYPRTHPSATSAGTETVARLSASGVTEGTSE
ncbi:ABC transporter permease [Streptomyces sp. NPDC048275]|uniref:ABC transporter permease n=1 Tax=Streptomyces sp. NPDC048275 TaxID=3155629 RepID=UPI003402CA4C